MRPVLLALSMILAFASMSPAAEPDPKTLEVTVTYRERIALPPGAELDVQLLDVSRADIGSKRIASQRFAMSGVPQTVSLVYDGQVIDPRGRYIVTAAIWSGDVRMFRTTSRHSVLDGLDSAPVEIVLTRAMETATAPSSIAGVSWSVTEVEGQPWGNDDPATLAIDDEMRFSIFGGCNRFSGQLLLADGEISVPPQFAGTLMACPEPAEMLERTFLDALRKATRYARAGAGLAMTDAEGTVLLRFEERPE